MPELTTEAALNILTGWLQENIDCGTGIIFDNDEDNTDQQSCCPGLSRHEMMFVTFDTSSFCDRPLQVSLRTFLITHIQAPALTGWRFALYTGNY